MSSNNNEQIAAAPEQQEIGGVGGSKRKQSTPAVVPPMSSNTKSTTSAYSQEDDTAAVFSSQKSQFTDYTTWKGISTKTGIDIEHAYEFILKELIDNGIDYLETQHNSATAGSGIIPPTISLTIQKQSEPLENFIRIKISNSTYGGNGKATFSKQMLKSIFDFNRYHSSKRNQFKVTKGALGDALKETLCIPYVLAHDAGGEGLVAAESWNHPLKIYAGRKMFQIHLIVDQINQLVQSKIDESEAPAAPAASITNYDQTQIEVTLPLVNGQDRHEIESKLLKYFCDYAVFATHIEFQFNDEYLNKGYKIPQAQRISPKWKNHSSGHYYSRKQFYDLILGLENNDSVIYSILYKTFREPSNMPKSELNQMSVGQLKHSPAHINQLYDELRDAMVPATTLALPFDVTKKSARAQAIKDRVEQRYGHVSGMKYKSAFGYHKDKDGESQFPFFFEIAIFHGVAIKNNLSVIQALNCSAIPQNSGFVFGGGEDFKWETPGSTQSYISDDIRQIFFHYGYSYHDEVAKCKKPHSLILLNLVSPKIEYHSYGKSRINFKPFADTVAKTTVLACMGGGGRSLDKPSKVAVLREILEERKRIWKLMDDATRLKHWWTQSDVFYATRKLLIIEYGYENEDIDRDYITGLIKEICEKTLSVKREEIGIIAADRAQLYFNGQWMDVGLKEIQELSLYGVDMLIIEKEGIAEQLALFADFYGIALLNTRGFLVEYASILSEKSEKEGCNIAILSDFDASGLVLAAKAPNAYRIGIDFETLEDLGLDIEEVEESYKPGTHLNPLQFGGEYFGVYPSKWIDYVDGKRIEINSVITSLDDNSKFWDWVVSKLREHFDNRDYNRATQVPEYKAPTSLDSVTDHFKQIGTSVVRERREKVQTRLADIGPGFLFDLTNEVLSEKGKPVISIAEYERRLTNHTQHIIESDKRLKPILQKIKQLDDELLLPLLEEEEVDDEDEDET